MTIGIMQRRNGIREQFNGGVRYGIKKPIYPTPLTPLPKMRYEKVNGTIAPTLEKFTGMYIGWNDPLPIYCMKGNPNIRTIMPLACKPNKAAIAEMKLNGKTVPPPFPVAEAKNGNGETVEVIVNDDDKIVGIKKKGLTPLQMGLIAVGGFLLLGG